MMPKPSDSTREALPVSSLPSFSAPCQPWLHCSVVSDFLPMQQALTKQPPYIPLRAVFIYRDCSHWLGKRFVLLVETNKNVSSGIQVLDADVWGAVWGRQLPSTWRRLGLLESYSPSWDCDEEWEREALTQGQLTQSLLFWYPGNLELIPRVTVIQIYFKH